MDYFQGVVAEYLRAKRSRFVNVEYLINLDRHGYRKDRHWYCDAVAVDFEDSTVRLCEITYSKTLQSVFKRLQSWCNHWPEIVTAVRRDSQLKGDWNMLPEVFVPGELKTHLDDRIAKLKWLALIRFGGHVPKGGYDVPNGKGCSGPASPATVL